MEAAGSKGARIRSEEPRRKRTCDSSATHSLRRWGADETAHIGGAHVQNVTAAVRILDRTQSRIPQPWRTIVDWFVTIGVAVAFVLTFQAQVAKPYRIPSPSMEPTLHCAKPTAFCQGRFSDRVIANRLAYRFGDPRRGQIVVFRAPETVQRCGLTGGGSTFVKRIIGLPSELVSERDGVIYIDGDRLIEPYVDRSLRGHETAGGRESCPVTTSYSATIESTPATPAPGEPCRAPT